MVQAFPADSDEDPYYLLKSGGMRKLADDHIWWSVFSRPIRSRFTRSQRVTVCMAMLYLFFLTNAMFYGIREERVGNPLLNIGMIGLDIYDVKILLIQHNSIYYLKFIYR